MSRPWLSLLAMGEKKPVLLARGEGSRRAPSPPAAPLSILLRAGRTALPGRGCWWLCPPGCPQHRELPSPANGAGLAWPRSCAQMGAALRLFTGLPGMRGRRRMTTCFQCLALHRYPPGSMCASAKGSVCLSPLLPNKDQVNFPKHILPRQTLLSLWRLSMALTLLWVFYPHPCAKDSLAGAAGCAWLLMERREAAGAQPHARAPAAITAVEGTCPRTRLPGHQQQMQGWASPTDRAHRSWQVLVPPNTSTQRPHLCRQPRSPFYPHVGLLPKPELGDPEPWL